MVVQPDGKIVRGGIHGHSSATMAALVRYNANGSLDTSFGSGGKLITAIPASINTASPCRSARTAPSSSYRRSDNHDGRFGEQLGPVRGPVQRQGTSDTGFGTGGEVNSQVGQSETLGGLAVQPDGKIIVAGSETNLSRAVVDNQVLVVRYTANGAPDVSFGSAGDGTAALPDRPGIPVGKRRGRPPGGRANRGRRLLIQQPRGYGASP